MNKLETLISEAKKLSPQAIDILLEMIAALNRPIDVNIEKDSDIATDEFVADFTGRLASYHAFNEQKLTKKTFEFIFKNACLAAGRQAEITQNSVFAGADVIVDGTSFSLKTEGAKSMNKNSIVISKLMEARWIRDCQNAEELCHAARERVVAHLQKYDRILVLRAFEDESCFRYVLREVPPELLMKIGQSSPTDFSPRTKNGSSRTTVFENGEKAFSLTLDGSVEKITISGLSTALCKHHASWRVTKT